MKLLSFILTSILCLNAGAQKTYYWFSESQYHIEIALGDPPVYIHCKRFTEQTPDRKPFSGWDDFILIDSADKDEMTFHPCHGDAASYWAAPDSNISRISYNGSDTYGTSLTGAWQIGPQPKYDTVAVMLEISDTGGMPPREYQPLSDTGGIHWINAYLRFVLGSHVDGPSYYGMYVISVKGYAVIMSTSEYFSGTQIYRDVTVCYLDADRHLFPKTVIVKQW